MTINNYLLFQFLKLYMHDEKKFKEFNFDKYKKSCNYGKYGSYGGFKWSNNTDISYEKKSLDPIEFGKPVDPLDTIFMFHDYKLSISKSKWDSFNYNNEAASSVLYLSRNYRIINLLTRMLSTPFIFLFSLTSTIHQTEYDEINNKVLNLDAEFSKVLNLDAEFRSYLKEYYESNYVNAYEILCNKCNENFIKFKEIYPNNVASKNCAISIPAT
jgi:hypothetical protein